MTNFEKAKKDIAEINKPIEFVSYLDGLREAAMLYCDKNYPDEIIKEEGQLIDISLYGMGKYLEMKINNLD